MLERSVSYEIYVLQKILLLEQVFSRSYMTTPRFVGPSVGRAVRWSVLPTRLFVIISSFTSFAPIETLPMCRILSLLLHADGNISVSIMSQ